MPLFAVSGWESGSDHMGSDHMGSDHMGSDHMGSDPGACSGGEAPWLGEGDGVGWGDAPAHAGNGLVHVCASGQVSGKTGSLVSLGGEGWLGRREGGRGGRGEGGKGVGRGLGRGGKKSSGVASRLVVMSRQPCASDSSIGVAARSEREPLRPRRERAPEPAVINVSDMGWAGWDGPYSNR